MDHTAGQVTPTHGNMNAEEHNAFLLRVFMYLVTKQRNKLLTVDLNDVLEATKDHTMMVGLDGNVFTAQAMEIPANMRN